MEFVGCLCTRNSFPFPYVFVCFSKKKKNLCLNIQLKYLHVI